MNTRNLHEGTESVPVLQAFLYLRVSLKDVDLEFGGEETAVYSVYTRGVGLLRASSYDSASYSDSSSLPGSGGRRTHPPHS